MTEPFSVSYFSYVYLLATLGEETARGHSKQRQPAHCSVLDSAEGPAL